MPDVFDTIAIEEKPKTDIFDTVAPSKPVDIFDQVAPVEPQKFSAQTSPEIPALSNAPLTNVAPPPQNLPTARSVAPGMPTNVQQVAPQGLNERGMQTLVNPILRAPVETARSAALLTIPLADQQGKEDLGKFVDQTTATLARLKPKADMGFVDNFVSGAVGLVPYLATGGAGGVSLLANSASRAVDAVDQGIDPKTATELGIKDLAVSAAMFKLPMGGSTIPSGVVKGAGVNVGLDILGKAVEKGILSKEGYQEAADKIKLLDPQSLGQSAAMGGVFGAMQSPTVSREAQAKLAAQNAERIKTLVPESQTATGQPQIIRARQEPAVATQESTLAPNVATEQPKIEPVQPPPGAVGGPDQPVKPAALSLPLEQHKAIMQKKTADMTPEEYRHALTHDELTGLPNTRALMESPEQPNLVLLDVDGFKQVNDRFGHDAGDRYLQAVREAADANGIDWLHRLHGDEHAFYAADQGQAMERLRSLDNALKDVRIKVTDTKTGEPYELHGVGYSHGIGSGENFNEKFKSADTDLYATKQFRTDFGQRVPGSFPSEVSVRTGSEGRGPENVQSGSVLPRQVDQVTPHPEKDLIEQAAYAMSEKKRYGADEPFMSSRPAGWTYDRAADFLHKVASGEVAPKNPAQSKFVDSVLSSMRDEQTRAADRERQGGLELHANPFLNPRIVGDTIGKAIDAVKKTGPVDGIIRAFYPLARGEQSKKTAMDIGESEARFARQRDTYNKAFEEADKLFTQSPDQVNIDFMQRKDTTGVQATPELQTISDMLQRMWDHEVDETHKVAPDVLQSPRENYMPHYWKKDSDRSAILSTLSNRPFGGNAGFLKKRFYDDINAGIAAGKELATTNPIELSFMKLIEMQKFRLARQTMKDLKDQGGMVFVKAGAKAPETHPVRINDRYGTVYGPPHIKQKEAFDKHVYAALNDVAKAIGVSHERVTRFKRGSGASAGTWGYATEAGEIKTRFAGPESVLAHEIGHEIDFKYGLYDKLWNHPGQAITRDIIREELRKLADLRYEGEAAPESFKNYVRKGPEKMAAMLEAYIHAPERFKEVAPVTFDTFEEFLKSKPELAPLTEIKPSLVLGTSTSKIALPGPTILGNYYATDEVGQVMNNYLSQNLYNNKYVGSAFKGYMSAAGALNQFQLGMGSMFHGGFTTMEAMISHNAIGIKQIFEGRFKEGAKTLATTPTSIYTTPKLGKSVIEEWETPGSHPEVAKVVDALMTGGLQLHNLKNERLQSTAVKRIREDLQNADYLKAAWHSPMALAEAMAKPIMQTLVPRQKFGVAAELANDWMKSHPNATHAEKQAAMWQIVNRVDSRLGQVIYSRLFAHNVAKNAVQALVRAPGWTGGTIIEVGGGTIDAAKFAGDILQGKKPVMTDKLSYTLSLLLTTAAVNGALTYLFTGEEPKDFMDFFAFRTGRKIQGRDERYLLPTYAKDMLAYAKSPVSTLIHKTNPMISMLADIKNNRDYYGVQIREGNIPEQIYDSAKYGIKQYVPFWMRGVQKNLETTDGGVAAEAGKLAAPLVGVMPAPRSVTDSKAESMMRDIKSEKPQYTVTQEQAQHRELKRGLKKELEDKNAGAAKDIFDQVQQGNLSRRDVKDVIRPSITSLQAGFKNLNIEEAMKVYEAATPEERQQLKGQLARKMRNSGKTLSPVKRRVIVNQYRKLMEAN